MIILIMLDAILIIFSVIVAIITGHEIDRLKAKIVELEQTKQEAFQRLREAQQRPEEYESLVVRIGGFSTYFNWLSRAHQDDIIARTEHQT